MTELKVRLASLDAFRGFDILVMVFVNYLAGMSGIPFFLQHAPAGMDAFTLTDVLFPGFLFIVGVAIPLSLEKRIDHGEPLAKVLGRILVRTAGLLFLGVIMVNQDRFSAAETGISREAWYFLAYAAAVVLWASYPGTQNRARRNLFLGMRIGAAAVLLFLVVVFRGVDGGTVSWLRHSWWGILGMIGWTYLAASLVYLVTKGNPAALMGSLGLMIALSIGARHGLLAFLRPINEFVNIGSLFGSHTAIVTAGMLVGSMFVKGRAGMGHAGRSVSIGLFGAGLLASGFLLRPIHGFSKIAGTKSFALATSGICGLLFLAFYVLMDMFKVRQ